MRKQLGTALLFCVVLLSGCQAKAEPVDTPAAYPSFSALDHVELGDLSGLSVTMEYLDEVPEAELTAMVDRSLREYVENYDGWPVLDSGTVTDVSDLVQMTYTCKDADTGELIPNTGQTDTVVRLSDNAFGFGFYEDLIGHVVGDTVVIERSYGADETDVQVDVQGKRVKFTVEITGIREVPEITDAVMRKVSDGDYETVDAYREQKAEGIRDMYHGDYRMQVETKLAEGLQEICKVTSLPDGFADWYQQHRKESLEVLAEGEDLSLEEYLKEYKVSLKLSEAELLSEVSPFLICLAIGEREGITVSDTKYAEAVDTMVSEAGYNDAKSFADAYGRKYLRDVVTSNQVMEWLSDRVSIVIETD